MTNKSPKDRDKAIFQRFLPAESIDYVLNLFYKFPVKFKIVNGRKTKLGDFRAGRSGEKHQITVNGDLNMYSFLITTVHEFAHLVTFEKYGHKVSPHGEEWKQEYRKLLLPLLDKKMVPKSIENALVRSLERTKASSCADVHLSRALMEFDKLNDGLLPLEKLNKNTTFVLQDRIFKKGELRRNRFLCEDVETRRKFTINCLAVVKPIEI